MNTPEVMRTARASTVKQGHAYQGSSDTIEPRKQKEGRGGNGFRQLGVCCVYGSCRFLQAFTKNLDYGRSKHVVVLGQCPQEFY